MKVFLTLCENLVNELSWRIKSYKKHLSETKQNSFPVWKHMLFSKFSQISFTLWSSWYDTFCLNKSSSLYFLIADLRNNLLCCIILMCLVWWFDRHIKGKWFHYGIVNASTTSELIPFVCVCAKKFWDLFSSEFLDIIYNVVNYCPHKCTFRFLKFAHL